jgi:hypothetical protein
MQKLSGEANDSSRKVILEKSQHWSTIRGEEREFTIGRVLCGVEFICGGLLIM